jgi:hypothetical protein
MKIRIHDNGKLSEDQLASLLTHINTTGDNIVQACDALGLSYFTASRTLNLPQYSEISDIVRRGSAMRKEAQAESELYMIDDDAPRGVIERQKMLYQHRMRQAAVRDPGTYSERTQVSVQHGLSLTDVMDELKGRAAAVIDATQPRLIGDDE